MLGGMTTLTFWGHSCVRFDGDGGALVVDPGTYSDVAAALDGASGVLVTHEHPDHVDLASLAPRVGPDLPVWGPSSVVDGLQAAGAPESSLHAVRAGDELEIAGHRVQVTGEWHAVIHRDLPRVQNVGYLVDGRVLHPGDALVEPPAGTSVDVLLTPVAAPWLRPSETVDYVRAVAPRVVVPIHDVQLSDVGRGAVESLLARLGGAGAPVRLAVGESLPLDD